MIICNNLIIDWQGLHRNDIIERFSAKYNRRATHLNGHQLIPKSVLKKIGKLGLTKSSISYNLMFKILDLDNHGKHQLATDVTSVSLRVKRGKKIEGWHLALDDGFL